jgi:hypothetical protein
MRCENIYIKALNDNYQELMIAFHLRTANKLNVCKV